MCNQHQLTYPVRHLVSVCEPVVVVENHDSGDDATCHHEHDAVKVGSWTSTAASATGSTATGSCTPESTVEKL